MLNRSHVRLCPASAQPNSTKDFPRSELLGRRRGAAACGHHSLCTVPRRASNAWAAPAVCVAVLVGYCRMSRQQAGAEAEVMTRSKKRKPEKAKKGNGFESMGLSPAVYRAIIRKGYRVPTPIQRKVINLVKGGRDVVAMARTGSGKTAAFLVPMLEQLQEHSSKYGARGVVLTPTRELAMQTLKFARELGAFTNLRTCLLVGGESLEDQFAALAANPDIIIATPGRLMHHLAQTDMTLMAIQLCVFDEADRLFEMGFADQIKEIIKGMPEQRQTCLFSATLPQILADFTSAGLHHPSAPTPCWSA
jgi:ATP-dependent RNA helicase DDX54/DBP10